MEFHVIIPARYASSRLPRKLLLPIAGKPMLQHVYERAIESGASSVTVATDHEAIQQKAMEFGAQVCMTAESHSSGTSRLAEAIAKLGIADQAVVVNVQGDEPFISPRNIEQVALNLIRQAEADVTTLCEPINYEESSDPNKVKVVFDKNGFALCFSRSRIPFALNNPALITYYRHIGLYAYHADFIKKYVSWPICEMEKSESLEQLRVLWNGGKIYVEKAHEASGIGVDTQEDYDRVKAIIE